MDETQRVAADLQSLGLAAQVIATLFIAIAVEERFTGAFVIPADGREATVRENFGFYVLVLAGALPAGTLILDILVIFFPGLLESLGGEALKVANIVAISAMALFLVATLWEGVSKAAAARRREAD